MKRQILTYGAGTAISLSLFLAYFKFFVLLINAIFGLHAPLHYNVTRVGDSVQVLNAYADMVTTYEEANNALFNDKLPKDVVIDWGLSSGNMAELSILPDGRYHIQFNEKYTLADRVATITLYHEMCHIKTWGEEDSKTQKHGPRWRTCMLGLDLQGAFRRQLIDFYEGN